MWREPRFEAMIGFANSPDLRRERQGYGRAVRPPLNIVLSGGLTPLPNRLLAARLSTLGTNPARRSRPPTATPACVKAQCP